MSSARSDDGGLLAVRKAELSGNRDQRAAIAALFVIAGLALVWLDRRLPLGSRRATR